MLGFIFNLRPERFYLERNRYQFETEYSSLEVNAGTEIELNKFTSDVEQKAWAVWIAGKAENGPVGFDFSAVLQTLWHHKKMVRRA